MKPLNSLPVIDASHRLAGRLAALLLADQGADVVRVHEHSEATPSSLLDEAIPRHLKPEQDPQPMRSVYTADSFLNSFLGNHVPKSLISDL
jgi:crotonobetainyl-CoA:carnitine CoA-transferase CaiB-like acyl-CoA transferase